MAIYIISDLHLSAANYDLCVAFDNFIKSLSVNDRVVIAGDLFDFFVGIDENDIAQNSVRDTLKEASAKGTRCYYIRGNRDFLMSPDDASYFSMLLLDDFENIPTPNGNFLITHGDLLCSNDTGYLRFRKICKMGWLQSLFRALPLKLRLTIGRKIRNKSSADKSMRLLTDRIYEVTVPTVDQYLTEYGVSGIVHGHTHVYGRFENESPVCAMRFSLGAWGSTYSYFRADKNGIAIVQKNIDLLLPDAKKKKKQHP